MFAGLGFPALFIGTRYPLQAVGAASQRNFPQCRQVFHGKKMIYGLKILPLVINLSFVQTFEQVDGFEIHHFHLIGQIEHTIRNTL